MSDGKMPSIPKSSRSHLRAVRAYLVGLLVLTFLLFSTSLISLVQQRQQVSVLSSTNLRANTERVALELEQQVGRSAAACLRDPAIARLLLDPSLGQDPEMTRRVRQGLAHAQKRYLIAKHFFLVRGSEVIYPRLTPWPALRQEIGRPSQQSVSEFWKAKARGDEEYLRHRFASALTWFRRAEALPVQGKLRALALSRIGKILLESGRLTDAFQAYSTLLTRYGDEYDETGLPYALTLLRLPEQLGRKIYPDYRQRLQALYQDMARGRWEMTGDQLDSSLRELEKQLSLKMQDRPATGFLDHFELARALAREAASTRSLPEEAVAGTLRYGGGAYQIFATSQSTTGLFPAVYGFSLDMAWLRQEVAARGQLTTAEGKPIEAEFIPNRPAVNDQEPDLLTSEGIVVPFDSNLASWALRVPIASVRAGEAAAQRELWFLGISAVMFLSIMGLGILLLVRVARDLQYLELRTDFVNAVSHELKTPLSLIRLYSETLSDGEDGFEAEERQRYIRIIARESQRLGQLIDNVLDYANIERGQQVQERRSGDLAAYVLQVVGDYSRYLSEQGLAVQTKVEPSLPPVRFDRTEISQVVLNLLDNARKYSDHSKLVHVRIWRQGNEVALEVEDHGIGIPADEQKKIFEPFYQIADGRKKSGSGLGLYLVRHVMDGLGGRIEVQSEAGRGSRFRLFFPAAGESPADIRKEGGQEAFAAGWRP